MHGLITSATSDQTTYGRIGKSSVRNFLPNTNDLLELIAQKRQYSTEEPRYNLVITTAFVPNEFAAIKNPNIYQCDK